MDVAVLTKEELSDLVRRAADLAVSNLREDIERTRTPELMTATQLAGYLHCNRSTINQYVKKGMPEERCGDQPRYRKTSIDLWLQGKWIDDQPIALVGKIANAAWVDGPVETGDSFGGSEHSG